MYTFPRRPATRKSYPSPDFGEACPAGYAIRLLKTDIRNPPVETHPASSATVGEGLAVRSNHYVRVVVPGRCVVMVLPAPYEGLGGYGNEEKE